MEWLFWWDFKFQQLLYEGLSEEEGNMEGR